MSKTRRVQKNGRERGNEGNGLGHWGDWSGGRATVTKNKKDIRSSEDRKSKRNGWID